MKRFVYSGILLFSLTSCLTMSKQERDENVISQPTLKESVNNVAGQEDFVLGDWPADMWWEIFESDELSYLIATALEQNPNLQAMQQRVDLASEQVVITSSKLYPLLYFNAGDLWQIISKNGFLQALNPSLPRPGNLIDLGLSFSYEFDFWSKYKNMARSAKLKMLSEAASYKQAELIVTTSIAQTYYALKTNLERKRLYKRLALVRKKFYSLQALLNRSALLSKIPQTYSQESYLQAKQFVAEINLEIASTKYMLNILRGSGPDREICVDEDEIDFCYDIEIPKTLNLELVARRPDLMAATFRVDALAFQVGVAVADFFPNVDLASIARLDTLDADNLFNIKDSGNVEVNPKLNLPIYTAGRIQANVRGKKAMFNQAVFEYNEILLRSTQEVADLLALLEAVFEKKEYQNKVIEQAELRLKIVSKNYHRGLDDLLQVYTSEEQLILQQLDEVELVYAQYVGAIKLIKALGGGYKYGRD